MAVIPTGAAISDQRFSQLASHITSFREIPLAKLPRRAASSRGYATFSGLSSSMRGEFRHDDASKLFRSNSLTRDIGAKPKHKTISATRSEMFIKPSLEAKLTPPRASGSSDDLSSSSSPLPSESDRSIQERHIAEAGADSIPQSVPNVEGQDIALSFAIGRETGTSSRPVTDLELTGTDVDSTFRLRYEVFHRSHAGTLIPKVLSEWDEFHSSNIRAVIGIADISDTNEKEEEVRNACKDFKESLVHFEDATVSRLIIFTLPSDERVSVPFNAEDQYSLPSGRSPMRFTIGFVPEKGEDLATQLELRAHVEYFAGLTLHAVDKECWKRRESPQSDVILSPIDEKQPSERQPKLVKRRVGRLDKLIADSLLLMGSPKEALDKYNSAIERAKAGSDRLWLAGAMEGWAAAHVLCHLGSGGHLSDPQLTDRVVESYSEIYKLYQKKRCAEPEAAAALRLAEFLGTWTNRRKDALLAAEHAATIGEGLKSSKRAALWEALAQFSERMGCRRKASFFLYRLGVLNASQSYWSSAVELLIAAEAQLRTSGRKAWPTLNRRMLLTAASHAEEASDSKTASKLYVEALVCKYNAKSDMKSDRAIISALRSIQVPLNLPAAKYVISLNNIVPLSVPGVLSAAKTSAEPENVNPAEAPGPFIYNPFEAKTRATQKGIAEPVTWISGEKAQVRVNFEINASVDLKVDIIAVLVNNDPLTNGDSSRNTLKDVYDEDKNQALWIHRELEHSVRIAKTVSETVTAWGDGKAVDKMVTVIPRVQGPLFITGLLVRLFDGALVLLRNRGSKETEVQKVPRVDVIGELPRIRMECQTDKSTIVDMTSSHQPINVYYGEKHRMSIEVSNVGKDIISWASADILEVKSSALQVSLEGADEGLLLAGIYKPRGCYTVAIIIQGRKRDTTAREKDGKVSTLSQAVLISLRVTYKGTESEGVSRESFFTLRVLPRAAVSVGRMSVFRKHGKTWFAGVEVRNESAVPASVRLEILDGSAGDGEHTQSGSSSNLVESEASIRVFGLIPYLENWRKGLEGGACGVRLHWNLLALGRQGALDAGMDKIELGCKKGGRDSSPSLSMGMSRDRSACRSEIVLPIIVDYNRAHGFTARPAGIGDMKEKAVQQIGCGDFWEGVVRIINNSTRALPPGTLLDIGLQHNGGNMSARSMQWSCTVGTTNKIQVGELSSNSDPFEHRIRGRIVSKGRIYMVAQLYHYNDSSGKVSEEGKTRGRGDVIQPSTIDSFDAVGQDDGRLIIACGGVHLNSC